MYHLVQERSSKRSRSCSSDGSHCPVQPELLQSVKIYLQILKDFMMIQKMLNVEEDLFKNKIDTSEAVQKIIRIYLFMWCS